MNLQTFNEEKQIDIQNISNFFFQILPKCDNRANKEFMKLKKMKKKIENDLINSKNSENNEIATY